MEELQITLGQVQGWFDQLQDNPYVLIRVPPQHSEHWPEILCNAVRRCYLSDHKLLNRIATLKEEFDEDEATVQTKVIASKLPGPGSTRAGEFGEILAYIYQAATAAPSVAFGPKRWRFKQLKDKPAPCSDVVQVIVPNWPNSSEDDELLCTEVKLKSTSGKFSPITAAIAGCKVDRVSRLSRTLEWFQDCALGEGLGIVTLAQIERFIKATDYPPAKKTFRALAVICSSLLEEELKEVPADPGEDYVLVVLGVANLHELYNQVFQAALESSVI
jgi:hypothetical protein